MPIPLRKAEAAVPAELLCCPEEGWISRGDAFICAGRAICIDVDHGLCKGPWGFLGQIVANADLDKSVLMPAIRCCLKESN